LVGTFDEDDIVVAGNQFSIPSFDVEDLGEYYLTMTAGMFFTDMETFEGIYNDEDWVWQIEDGEYDDDDYDGNDYFV
jgi:hypothetical protein